MTLDGKALVAIIGKEAGFERIFEAIVDDENPRVSATALAEAAILLTARGDSMAEIKVQTVINGLHLSVVPFTEDDWREAVRAYERSKSASGPRPAFAQCLSAAVAAKLGAPLLE